MILTEAVRLLGHHGITKIVIHYSGSGDSGSCEQYDYFIKNKQVQLDQISSNDPLKIAEQVGQNASNNLRNKKTKEVKSMELLDASIIENALDNATNLINGDWYNNEGGQGTITINTKTLKVSIAAEFNVLTQETEHQEHQL